MATANRSGVIKCASYPATLSPQTRAALLAEFRAARDARDVARGREIYRTAAAHDDAHPGEPSLVDELIAVHADALKAVTS